MCTLALYTRVAASIPLLVAANRDEFLERPTAPPRVLSTDPWVVAGQDLEAGGTWLGLNEHGIVIGLLNRRTSTPPDPSKASRGILCLQALQCRSIEEVAAMLRSEKGDEYNRFTLLAASVERAIVGIPGAEHIETLELDAGVHLITNLEVNDPTCPRIARSHQLFEAVDLAGATSADPPLAQLQRILADHTTQLDPRSIEEENGLCIHFGPYGTRSSAVICTEGSGRSGYWHAEGPPCETPLAPVVLPTSE